MFTKILSTLFGNKKERDLKELKPYAEQVNAEYAPISSISDEDLRNKSREFRQRIADHLKKTDDQITELKTNADIDKDISTKDEMYNQIDKLKKDRKAEIEVALAALLPEAFAVVKETARRFAENGELRVQATDWDRELAAKKPNVIIEGDTAIWLNKWNVADNELLWNMVHYDVQLMGGVVLHQGKIAEMATGEGKTLVATLPVYLNALPKEGVHVVTVNNYLATRDAEWNAPLFEFHEISVDCIDLHEPNTDERRKAYEADITYGTNNEFGFDYLRDNMTTNAENLVQRGHHFAIIDEIDSVLIDEARTPLIISGPVPKGDIHEFHALKPRIEKLVKTQRKEVTENLTFAKKHLFSEDKEKADEASTRLFRAFKGLPRNKALIKYLSEPGVKSEMLKKEGFFMQDKSKNMYIVDDPLYFVIDEKNNQIEMTEIGRELITAAGEDPDLFVMPDVGVKLVEIDTNPSLSEEDKIKQKEELSRDFAQKSERLHTINQLLKAYTLFEKDNEYIVQDDKVQIVDEQTGRVLPGRRYSDGLHQAIEAKENVKVEAATQTFSSVTLQNYFRMYHKLCGMTGTAETEAAEFYEIYKLDVVVIPTNRPITRLDDEDLVYKTKREKYNAVIDEIEKLVALGRPVLVGTTSVEVSELLSRMLRMRKLPHNVLNAKQHQREAEIVAEAGLPGNITIATNMAGRGTDIKLSKEVIDAGGLAIIGTERHESRRIDRQLRGRAGRQGDNGSSQFFVSLEDDLMRLFGSERIAKVMDRIGIKEGEVIQHSMISKSISNAQKKVEENNFGMRKRLLEYDDVMNSQREVIYTRRRNALFGERIQVDIDTMLVDFCTQLASAHYNTIDSEGLRMDCLRFLAIDPGITVDDLNNLKQKQVAQKIYDAARSFYDKKAAYLAESTHEGLKAIRENQPNVELIQVNFTDGQKVLSVVVELEKALQNEGAEVASMLEKTTMLAIIDDKWKNHLREMDNLRTSVQNAVFEQKDPLLVYKFESFELFQQVLAEINEDAISLLFKAKIMVAEDRAKNKEKARRDDFSRMKASHDTAADVRKKEARKTFTNSPEQERPVSRRERREQERTTKKRR